MRRFLLPLLLLLAACTPAPSDSPPQSFAYHAAAGTEKIFPDLYDCADRTQFGLAARTPNISQADLIIRLTAPQNDLPAYQIGAVELVLAANLETAINSLSREEIISIYTGKIRNWAALGGDDAEIQVWVYGAGNELQQAFNETMLTTGKISSNARQAQSSGAMRDALSQNKHALGIIPRAEVGADLQILSTINTYPILALLPNKTETDLSSLIYCLQSK